MFKTRLISGIILVLIALATIIYGGDVLFVTLLAISLIGMWELYRVMNVHTKILGVVGYGAAVLYYALIQFDSQQYVLPLAMAALIALMAAYVFTYPKYKTEQVTHVYFGIFYVAVMLSCVYLTRMLPDGVYTVWLIFLCSWGCDTCAYCAGMLLGKHKLAPKLSPKKSVEGAVGGVLGAALLGGIYAAVVGKNLSISGNVILMYAGICAAGAVISQIGDLAASAIKRNHEIKDYGRLIPGHGGILDRFDSVIFTAPIIYFLAAFISK